MWITTDENGRIIGTSEEDMSEVGGWRRYDGKLPDNFSDYRLQNDALIYDPLPPEPYEPTAEERLAALEAAVLEMILGGVET